MIRQVRNWAVCGFLFFFTFLASYSATAQSCTTKYAVSVNNYTGSLLDLSETTTGAADGAGVKFNRGNTGSSNTQMTWDMGEVIPSGTQVTFRVKLEHCINAASGVSNASFRVCAKDLTSGSMIAQGTGPYNFSNIQYHDYTVTLDRASRYLQVEDLGGCAFRVDNMQWLKCTSNPLACAKVTMDNMSVCSGSSTTLSPVIDLTGYAEASVDSQGNVDNLQRALEGSDGLGAYFCKGTSGTYTRGVWRMACDMPIGTKVCLRIKASSSSNASYRIFGGLNSITNPTSATYTLLSTQNHAASSYVDVCITLTSAYRYIKIEDMGGSPFYVDEIKYTANCTPTYAWSTGATTASITVSPTVNTNYSVITTVCGVSYYDTATVVIKPCYPISCTRKVANTRGCSSTPYVLFLKDKNGTTYELSGDSTQYTWTQYTNGDARLTATGLTAAGLAGTYNMNLLYTGFTNGAPANSPKLSSCFTTTGTGWSYWTSTSGTITSSTYGTLSIGRAGPAMQIGDGANITQSGFGASGWLTIAGGGGQFTAGDINVMLADCGVIPPTPLTCTSGKYKWENTISVSGNTVNASVRFIDGQTTRFKLPSLPAVFSQAVKITVGEVVSWDGYTGRENVIQPNEQWKVVFYKGGSVVYQTPYTTDVADNAVSAEWIGSLGVTTTFATGLDSIVLVHYEDPTNGSGSASTANSVVPVGVCITYETIANKIKGTVWNDNNNNNTIDGTEAKRSGVKVYLYKDTNGNGVLDAGETTPIDSTTTISDGSYEFNVIYAGGTEKYIMTTNPANYPAGYKFTSDNIETATFTSGGNTVQDKNFGFMEPNTISGRVFLDANVNGTLNTGETRRPGTKVYLYKDTNGNGTIDAGENTPIDSAVTDATGLYTFKVYYNGSTDNYIMAPRASDFPAEYYLTTAATQTAQFTNSVQTDIQNDFGYNLPNKIKGVVFNDINGNGTRETTEPVYAGVTVRLINDANNNGVIDAGETTPIKLDTTDSNGEYLFAVPYTGGTNSFIMNTDTTTYPAGTYQTTANQQTAQFTSGGNLDQDNEFGFDAANTITGTVFNDYNADGTKQSGEPGKSGIKVYLYKDANGNGTLDPFEEAAKLDSTTTNASGFYSFSQGYIPGMTDKFFTKTNLSNYPTQSSLTTDNIEEATFTSGNNTDPNNNFGFRETNTMTGTVYTDYNGNAVKNTGEPGQAGIKVYLYSDANNNGIIDAGETTPIDSTVTVTGGTYQFVKPYTGGTNSFIFSTKLGDYPAGTSLTTDNIEVASFTSGNNTDANNDFGFRGANTITGVVYNDYNKNQIKGATEPGKSGIKVYLYADANNNGTLDAGETTPIDSLVSSATGKYSFTRPFTGGTNSFITTTKLTDYPSLATLTTDNIETASFTSSNNVDSNNNFGFSEKNKISGVVFKDSNLNGVLNSGEPRRSLVTVNLFADVNNNGVLDPAEASSIQTASTNSNGEYIFEVDYTGGTNSFIVTTLKSTYPAKTYFTTDNIEVASFTTGSNEDPNNNFGYSDNNEITGTVFEDSDNDGFHDVGESGTYNVLVLLYKDVNNNSVYDAGDTFADSIRTNATGNYQFDVPYTGGTNSFIVKIDTTTLPTNASLTTDNIEIASFTSGGNTDPNNDFGHNGCSTNTGLVGPNNGCAIEDQVFAASPAVSGATYTWTFTGGSHVSVSTASGAATQIAQWDTSGVFDIKLIVAIPGCVDTFSKAINITRAVYASAAPGDTICDGRNTVLDGRNSSTGVNFAWTVESGDPYSIDIGALTSQPTVSPAVTTVYKMTVTDQLNGCSRVQFVTVHVDVNRNPTAVIAAVAPVCEGERVYLNGKNSVAPVTNASGTLYHYWYKNGTVFKSFSDTASTIVNTSTNFRLIVFDGVSLCPDTADVTVVPLLKPVVSVSKVNPTCQMSNGKLILSITNNPTRNSIKFSIDGGATYPYTTNDNVGTYTISNLPADFYNVYAVWSNDDCPKNLGTTELEDTTVIPTVSVLYSKNGGSNIPADTAKLEGLDVLDLYANSNGTGTYLWSGVNSFSKTTQGVNVTLAAAFADTGKYIVQFTNTDGCKIKDSIYVEVKLYNTVSGTVYKDNNANSTLDANEPGLTPVIVYIYKDLNGDGVLDPSETTPIATKVTNASGKYDFKLPSNGGIEKYIIKTNRANYPSGIRYTEEADNQREVNFTGGNQNSPNNNFGYVPNMAIGSTVFKDLNKDGILNAGDSAIAGVIIQVFADVDSNGIADNSFVLGQDTTDASGNYYIGNLVPGKYVVVIPASNFATGKPLKAYPASSPGSGSDNGVDGDDNGIQDVVGSLTKSATITLTENAEPTTESGLGAGQEATNGTINSNGDMTIDFGFYCGCDVALSLASSQSIIVSNVDDVNLTFSVTNTGNQDLENVASSAKYTRDLGTNFITLTAPSYVSGDANTDGKLSVGETWVFQLNAATFTYERGDRIQIKALVQAEACKPVQAEAEFTLRTFGTNVDVIMPTACIVPGQTIQVDFITRLLIDEDFEKAPTNAAGNPIEKIQYNAYLTAFTITGVNGGASFDPFNPPSGVNISYYQDEGSDKGRITGNVLDECEPINSIKLPCTGNQDVHCEFPDWRFTIDVLVPSTTNLDSFKVVAQDVFDVDLFLETGVGTNTYTALTSLNNQAAQDSATGFRCDQDFGDLDNKYGMTSGIDGGAYHIIVPGLKLGALIDKEYTGVGSAAANNDDNTGSSDEDGWQNASDTLFNGDTAVLEFSVFNTTGADAYLTIFIDANDDGIFDSTESVVDTVPSQIAPQTRFVTYPVPANIVQGSVNMRVRLTTTPNIGPSGRALDGEVEDYGNIVAVPVELVSLTAKLVRADDVLVEWSTASELNNEGFEIQRRMEGESEFKALDFVQGNGTTSEISNYQYLDNKNIWNSNIAYYRLKQIDYNGAFVYSPLAVVLKKGAVDALVYPNPTKNQATISIMTDAKKLTSSIVIRDLFGADVSSEVDVQSSNSSYSLDTRALRNGTYFIEITINDQKVVKKLMVTR